MLSSNALSGSFSACVLSCSLLGSCHLKFRFKAKKCALNSAKLIFQLKILDSIGSVLLMTLLYHVNEDLRLSENEISG
jgi:hypothetical protein